MSISRGITDGGTIRWYFSKSTRIVHFSITLLIIIIYRQNYRRDEKSSVLFDGFL